MSLLVLLSIGGLVLAIVVCLLIAIMAGRTIMRLRAAARSLSAGGRGRRQ